MRVHQPSGFLKDILKDARNGRLAPAGMQRDYVWSPSDIEALMDSVQDGLPIGAMVTWMPDRDTPIQEMARGRLGPIEAIDSGEVRELILDGQNRLATFAWLENDATPDDASPAEREAWLSGRALYLDAESGRIRFMKPEVAEAKLCLTAAAVLSSTRGNQETRRLWDSWLAMGHAEKELDAFLDLLDETQRRFFEAKIVKTVIEDATPDEARSVFLRVCKTGVPMSVEDFDRAVSWKPTSAAGPK